QFERNTEVTRLHQSMAEPPRKNRALGRCRCGRVNRRMRLLQRRRTQFKISDLPELPIQALDVIGLENLNQHAQAFFKARRALGRVEAKPIEYPGMAASDTEHDSPPGEQVGGSDLAREHRGMMRRRADNTGEKPDALRALRRRNVKPERKGRAGK